MSYGPPGLTDFLFADEDRIDVEEVENAEYPEAEYLGLTDEPNLTYEPNLIYEPDCITGENSSFAVAEETSLSTKFSEMAESADSDPVPEDPYCQADNPKRITFEDVSAASFRVANGIRKTPCSMSHLSKAFKMDLFFKKEQMQYTGSFKERGARYTLLMLSKEQKEKGVIAASAGNHALAMAYHGLQLKIPVTLVMPITAPIMKVSGCRGFHAEVILKGNDISESREHALRLGRDRGLMYVNGYDHPHILAGQGTMGLEIMEQVPDVEAVIIPAGGGGLIAGSALAIKSMNPNVLIYGAESTKCPSFSAAMQAGRPVYTKAGSSLADGLAVPLIGHNAFATAAPLIDKMLVVDEDFIAIAILRLIEVEKSVVEGAGATGLAALVQGLCPELEGKKVVVALCGGNIDTTVLGRCLERGLAADDRLCRFVVHVSDRPGGIAELTKLMLDLRVSIKDIFHERAWIKSDIYAVAIKCVVETRDTQHAYELKTALFEKYENVVWGVRNSDRFK